jgi:carbonic anhydrase
MPEENARRFVSRRELLAGGTAMVSTASLPQHAVAAEPPGSMTSVIATFTQRNEAFAHNRFSSELKIVPSLRTIIIGCVDPRVDPAEIFSLRPGEAAIIRNVGGRVFPSTLETMDMLSVVAKAAGGSLGKGWNLVLLHHTDCGINRLAQSPEMLAKHFGVAPSDLPGLAVTDPRAAIAVDAAALKADSRLSGEIVVSGLVYDVATGRATTVMSPAPLRQQSDG